MAELTLRSPVNGFVVEKIANVGEVVGAGMPVATLIDPDSLYLRLFVDTIENGKIKLGDKAVIFTDAYPDRPIAASVVNIAQKAEFTPKEVSVRSDRIQWVFAVHLVAYGRGAHRVEQADLAVDFAQQRQSAVAGQVAAVEIGLVFFV
jgi:HlyD family secretion protein